MQRHPKRVIANWIATWFFGLIVGTLIIAVTSPLFVRSYSSEQFDSARDTVVQSSGPYRWRSEGYATTVIGRHGMPGRPELPPNIMAMRVALWGDSQAEGVCVPDDQKLFVQIEHAADQLSVLPLARSGQDAAHWLTQMPAVERNLGVQAHLLLIVDLPDLLTATRSPVAKPDVNAVDSRSAIANRFPAFIIQAGRYLVTDIDGDQRKLRFTVGPTSKPIGQSRNAKNIDWQAIWTAEMQEIRQATKLPIVIVYAPKSPQIAADHIQWDNPAKEQLEFALAAAKQSGITVVDTSNAIEKSARKGAWPYGFHNGQIGSGHLNAIGYQVIAAEIHGAQPFHGGMTPRLGAPR